MVGAYDAWLLFLQRASHKADQADQGECCCCLKAAGVYPLLLPALPLTLDRRPQHWKHVHEHFCLLAASMG